MPGRKQTRSRHDFFISCAHKRPARRTSRGGKASKKAKGIEALIAKRLARGLRRTKDIFTSIPEDPASERVTVNGTAYEIYRDGSVVCQESDLGGPCKRDSIS